MYASQSPCFTHPSALGHRELGETIHCVNRTAEDRNATAVASQIITVSCALIFYLVVVSLSALSACFSWSTRLLSMPVTYVLFLVGALMESINIFTNEAAPIFKDYYRISSGSFVGIAYFVVGGFVFFQKAPSCTSACRPLRNRPCLLHSPNNVPILARQQPSMGFVVGGITGVLVVIELFLIIFTRATKASVSKDEKDAWGFSMAGECVLWVQKMIQVVMYGLLRYRMPSKRFGKENAAFYFKVLSFFNFIQWLDSVINSDTDLKFTKVQQLVGSDFNIIETVYKALRIDYRLLCSLLFLEHSLEINEEANTGTGEGNASDAQGEEQRTVFSQHVTVNAMTFSDGQKRSLGYGAGAVCMIVQWASVANYTPKFHIGPWVHIFAILVYMFLTVCGAIMVTKNDLEIRHESDKESAGIKIMVCCMGVVGFVCWIFKASLSAFWATTTSSGDPRGNPAYFSWAAAKLAVRGVGSLSLMVVFAKVNPRVIARRNPDVKINYFLVPAMMLGILSEFVSSVIDQAIGPVDKRLRCEVKDSTSLSILMEAGPAMHLGFCIHLFLHFLITQRRMGKVEVEIDTVGTPATETTPLIGSR